MTKINELTKPEDLSEIGQKFFFKDAIYMVAEETKEADICGCTGCVAQTDDPLCDQLPLCSDRHFPTNVIFIKVT